jgi:hypothetical protein
LQTGDIYRILYLYLVIVLSSMSVYSVLLLHLKLDCQKFLCILFVGTEFLL